MPPVYSQVSDLIDGGSQAGIAGFGRGHLTIGHFQCGGLFANHRDHTGKNGEQQKMNEQAGGFKTTRHPLDCEHAGTTDGTTSLPRLRNS